MLLHVYVFMMYTGSSVMVVVFTLRHVTTGDRGRSHVRPCGISDVQSIFARVFLRKLFFFFTFQKVRDHLLKFVHFLVYLTWNLKSKLKAINTLDWNYLVQTQCFEHTGRRIYDMLTLPAVLWGCETWEIREPDKILDYSAEATLVRRTA